MPINYDYTDLLNELKEDIEDNILELDEEIQILRQDKSIGENYYPIVDYYYSHERMLAIFEIENLYEDAEVQNLADNLEELEDLDEEFANLEEEKALYEQDREFLTLAKVSEVVEEMQKFSFVLTK